MWCVSFLSGIYSNFKSLKIFFCLLSLYRNNAKVLVKTSKNGKCSRNSSEMNIMVLELQQYNINFKHVNLYKQGNKC